MIFFAYFETFWSIAKLRPALKPLKATNNQRRPLRATWALLLWPTWLAAYVREPTPLFVAERGLISKLRGPLFAMNAIYDSKKHLIWTAYKQCMMLYKKVYNSFCGPASSLAGKALHTGYLLLECACCLIIISPRLQAQSTSLIQKSYLFATRPELPLFPKSRRPVLKALCLFFKIDVTSAYKDCRPYSMALRHLEKSATDCKSNAMAAV